VQLIKRNIPNLFTSLNFLCGCFAASLAYKNLFEAAFLLVLLGAFFDLFDGFFARLLKVESQFGLQFDSMADIITSGIVPGVVMYQLFLEIGIREIYYNFFIFQNEFVFSFAPFALVGFLISLGAGIRLSNFNIDSEQRHEFKGLPAPANALFIVSLPLLMEHPLFEFLKPFLTTYPSLVFISIFSAILMNIRFPLFSFKIKSFEFREYGFQLLLVLLVAPSFYFLQWVAVPVMIVIYLILNVLKNSFN
jgi:CDP-diacylglycerol--serine O-phosphatidyltransferase|tara:strand:+ start:234 stop:980 length:747 start_codon:yes stop_codon:yes gene_type:complete